MAAPSDPHSTTDALARGRDAIDRVDAAIVSLVAERMRLAVALGAVKRASDLPLVDRQQEDEVLDRAAERAREAGLDDEAVRELFLAIVEMARRVQGAEPDGPRAA